MAKRATPSKDRTETLAEEARDGYDMAARLAGMDSLTDDVTIFTDAVTGKALGGAEDIVENGIVMGRRRWGIQGKLDEAMQRTRTLLELEPRTPREEEEREAEALELEDKIAELRKAAKPLIAKLNKTAMVFTLRSIPELVIKDSRRIARKNLGIKTKGIQGREEEYLEELTCVIIAASTVQWVDNKDGSTHHSISVEQVRALQQGLPRGQFPKLDAKIHELSLEASIGNLATDSADF